MSIHTLIREWQQIGLISWLQNDYGWITENGKPLTLTPWQHALLGEYLKRREDITTLVISCPKKAGKTTLNSGVVAYRWLTIPGSLHFAVANDQSQAEELQFNLITAMVKRHPILSRYTRITKDTLTFEPTGSRIVSLPMDAPGAAGANFATVSFSELWGFTYETGQRLYEELTPIPLVDCLRIIDSYAGFNDESELLQRVWDRGKDGDRVNAEWPIYLTGQQLSYIHSGEDAQRRCWRGSEAARISYYQEQKETLRANTYSRLHLNEWVDSVGEFVEAEDWQACISLEHKPLPPGSSQMVYIGLDLAIGAGGDDAVVTGVYGSRGLAHLAFHQSWLGKDRNEKLKISETVMPYLLECNQKYNIGAVCYDPWQAALLAELLEAEGFNTIEVTQSHASRGPRDTLLEQLIKDRRLVLYDHPEVKRAAAGASAKTLPNGMIFLTKPGRRKKIDFMVSLSNCTYEAIENESGTVAIAMARVRML